jgi:transposase
MEIGAIKKLRKRRIYSEEFKRELVGLFEQGTYSVPQLEKLYGVHCGNVYEWIYKYSTFNEKSVCVVEKKESHSQKLKELEQQVKELERLVGQKQIKIEYLEKMIDIAKQEYQIDIKKNFITQPLSGLKNIQKKGGIQ